MEASSEKDKPYKWMSSENIKSCKRSAVGYWDHDDIIERTNCNVTPSHLPRPNLKALWQYGNFNPDIYESGGGNPLKLNQRAEPPM